MTGSATDARVDQMGCDARDPVGVTFCTISREAASHIVGRTWRSSVFDGFMAQHTTVFFLHMTLYAMVVARREESGTMGQGLGLFVALHTRVFLVTGRATLAIPLGMRTVQTSIPGKSMVVRFHDAMAGHAVFFFDVTLHTVRLINV